MSFRSLGLLRDAPGCGGQPFLTSVSIIRRIGMAATAPPTMTPAPIALSVSTVLIQTIVVTGSV
jgi:hypothetical protein